LSDTAYEVALDRLDDRADWLRENGDRADRMEHQGRREIDPDLVECTGDPDHGQSGDALEKMRNRRQRYDRTTDPRDRRQAVTDGGHDRGANDV
jgi:hypothetical protein